MTWVLHPDLQPLLAHGQPIFLVIVAAIIFAECGLLVGFVLPGDSLLFAAGLVAALAGRPSLWVLIPVCFVAAALGDQAGYLVGANVGPRLFTRPDSRLFRHQNVVRTRAFFDRHGPRAIVLARFVPVVRTFTPAMAGASGMRYRTFVTFNLVGAALWSVLATVLGYALASRFPQLENYLTPILLAVVVLSVVPVLVELRKDRRATGLGAGPDEDVAAAGRVEPDEPRA